jgi:hypothetical protein
MRASIAERSARKETPRCVSNMAPRRRRRQRSRRLKMLRYLGDSPKYRSICVDLKASSLKIGFFHRDDSPVNFLQYTGVRTLARFLLTLSTA